MAAFFQHLRRKPSGRHVFLFAFDLLELDGEDLRREPFETRKATLASLLRGCLPGLRINEHLPYPGKWCSVLLARWGSAAARTVSYGANFPDLYRRAGDYADKILRGAKPGDLPVEQATKFITIANLKTAKALGLDVPLTLLARADEVIE